jgi:hypothetical protein
LQTSSSGCIICGIATLQRPDDFILVVSERLLLRNGNNAALSPQVGQFAIA